MTPRQTPNLVFRESDCPPPDSVPNSKRRVLASTKKLLFSKANNKPSYQDLEQELRTALERLVIKDNYIEYLEERLELETKIQKDPSLKDGGDEVRADLDGFLKDQEEKWEALIADCWREMFEEEEVDCSS